MYKRQALQAVGLIDPGVVIQGGEVVHDGGQQLKSGVLAGPVAAPVAAALDGAVLDVVKQLVGSAQLTLGVVGDGCLLYTSRYHAVDCGGIAICRQQDLHEAHSSPLHGFFICINCISTVRIVYSHAAVKRVYKNFINFFHVM